MNKKPSAVAIVVAVIFSILLFPLILLGSISSGAVLSAGSLLAPNREEELYQSFVDKGGIDTIYEVVAVSMEEEMGELATEFNLETEKFVPKQQVETIIHDVYHAVLKGEEYQFDFSYQKDALKETMMVYFENHAEDEFRAEIGAAYDMLSEEQKKEAMDTARAIYEADITLSIEEEIGAIEKGLSEEFKAIYETEEYKQLKSLEEETGYSLTDRTKLCADVRLAGNVLLGITGFLMLLVILCHWFRPSGFFTAGGFALVIGGLMTLFVKAIQGVLLSAVNTEIKTTAGVEEFPEFIMPMVEEVMGWCLTGFEKVGKIGLMAAAILILAGILLLIIRKNKAETEPMSGLEMQ